MFRTTTCLILTVILFVVGCSNDQRSSRNETIFEQAIVAGNKTRVVMTEEGKGTSEDPIGIDFEFGPDGSSQ